MSGELRRVRRDTTDIDRISNLPVQVIDLILSYLPIRDVVRTSVLSTKWRYQWSTVPKLDFDAACLFSLDRYDREGTNEGKALVRIIDHVFLLHTGPIEVLQMQNIDANIESDIDRWMLHVSRRAIKEFIFNTNFDSRKKYTLHSSLYNCMSLINLALSGCLLRPRLPLHFMGWASLKSLHLEDVDLTEYVLMKLISFCPLVEELRLIDLGGIGNLHIDAQNLRYIDIEGEYYAVTFGCTQAKLAVLSINFMDDCATRFFYKEVSWIQFFESLPRIRRLKLKNYFLKCLCAIASIPESLPCPCNDLHHLVIAVSFDAPRENLAILCLLNSSPNLTKLKLKVCPDCDPNKPSIWGDGSKSYCKLEKLQYFKMVGVVGTTAELEFMRFVLLNSPVLREMTVVPGYEDVDPNLLKALLRFRRASAKAEIIYDDVRR